MQWLGYSVFLGTAISVVSLTHIAWREHDREQPRTLSELAASQEHVLRRFRNILLLCGSLFAVTMYGSVVPRIDHRWWLVGAWSVTYLGDLLAGLVPARGQTRRLHDILAQAMGGGMLATAYLFWASLSGATATIEAGIACVMTGLAAMVFIDRPRFIFYELPFIFLSHASIVVATLALW